jgi:hypothetical protein
MAYDFALIHVEAGGSKMWALILVVWLLPSGQGGTGLNTTTVGTFRNQAACNTALTTTKAQYIQGSTEPNFRALLICTQSK